MADDFKYVKSKSRKKNRQDELIKNPEIYANDLFNKVEKCKKSLRDDDFRLYASKAIYNLKELTKTNFNFNRIKIVCYGKLSLQCEISHYIGRSKDLKILMSFF